MSNNTHLDFVKFLIDNDNFLIVSHESPDGDNIGSSSGLYYALKKLNKEVIHIIDDEIPQNLNFLIDYKILKSKDIDLKKYNIISLDCGDIKRINCDLKLIENKNMLLNIDHHASNNHFGDLNIVHIDKSSTCEVVYDILREYEKYKDEEIIDKKIARSLYTGLLTDTGNFMYSNTKKESFYMAGELLKRGVDTSIIINTVFLNNPIGRITLIKDVIETLEINRDFASILMTKYMLEKNNVDYKDTDGIVNYARDIENINVGVLFKEKEKNITKISLRSKSDKYNLNEIAKLFSGGGHVRAAGCTINQNINDAKKIFFDKLKENKII